MERASSALSVEKEEVGGARVSCGHTPGGRGYGSSRPVRSEEDDTYGCHQ